MKLRSFLALAVSLTVAVSFLPAAAQSPTAVSAPPVFVPDYSHANDPLPNGVIAWDAMQKNLNATNGQDFARFVFAFTNIATKLNLELVTNVTYATNLTIVTNTDFWSVFSGHKYGTAMARSIASTNVVAITNSVTGIPVTILSVHPSCGCTTAELPPVPWILPPGTNSIIKINVNIAGKSGVLPKFVTVSTDKGKIDLHLLITIAPPPPPRPLTDAERAQGVAAAKVDRQAIFKGDCASCHAKNVAGKYSQQLFASVCAVCHEANPRATMVPDLHHLKDPTSEEFWRAWITSGKAGTLMPAFSTAEGGPLNDMQIASLAVFLNATIPPHPAAPAAK